MATFRVGQRVRIVGYMSAPWTLGMETTITGEPFQWGDDGLCYPNSVADAIDRPGTLSCHLAPLTDPGADAFLARLKKLGSEPVNDAPKVTERVAK